MNRLLGYTCLGADVLQRYVLHPKVHEEDEFVLRKVGVLQETVPEVREMFSTARAPPLMRVLSLLFWTKR